MKPLQNLLDVFRNFQKIEVYFIEWVLKYSYKNITSSNEDWKFSAIMYINNCSKLILLVMKAIGRFEAFPDYVMHVFSKYSMTIPWISFIEHGVVQ